MLTNAAAKAAGASDRAYKLADQGGLHLFVRPTGSKTWRLKYRWRGREKLLTIGSFPDVNLAQARLAAGQAKDQLARDVDPSAVRGAGEEGGPTFAAVARDWHALHCARWGAAHAADVLASLELHVFPLIGGKPVAAIGAAELVQLVKRVERAGKVEAARRLRQRLRQIFAFAIAGELAETNPAANLGAAVAGVALATPHRSLKTAAECRALLVACEAAAAPAPARLAHRFLALTAVRWACVRGARWEEIEGLDGPEPLWRVPAARMKLARAKKGAARFDHLLPLSPAAVAVLREAGPKAGGLIFPGRGGTGPLGENALRDLLAEAGWLERHVPHGWRAAFSTICNEALGWEWRQDIDRALAHTVAGKVEAAYNHAQLLPRRRAVLERWAELLGA